MSKGPEQLRLEQAVGEPGSRVSDADTVRAAGLYWAQTAQMLDSVADKLLEKSGYAYSISDRTGPAMSDAFVTSSEAMRAKAHKMREGAKALSDAGDTLKAAEDASAQMRPLNDPGTYTGPSQPKTKEEVAAKGQYDTALATYQQDREHNERLARQHNTAMDQQNAASTAVMKSIHGEPDPEPEPTAASGSTGARAMGGGSGHGTTYTSSGGGGQTSGGGGSTWQPAHSGSVSYPAGGHDAVGVPTDVPAGAGTGAPAGSTAGGSGTPTLTSPVASGTTEPSAGASVGGIGAALGAGALGGAGTALGGIRGGSMPASSPSVTGSGGRSIGSASRSSSSGTLGRSAVARAGVMSEAEESAATRSSTTRSSGAGAAGSTSRSGTGAGSRAGAAGQTTGRGGGRGGVGSAGSGHRRNTRRGSGDRDHLLVDEDWIDDEGEAPPVLA